MSDSSGYTAVVAVRYVNNAAPMTSSYLICSVPNGVVMTSGEVVYFGEPDAGFSLKGICISDTLYLPQDTLEMVCRVTNTPITDMPVVHGKAHIEWYTTRKERAIEQTLL